MPGDTFSVQVSRLGASIVIAPFGELDLATCPQVQAEIEAAPDAPIVLDLRGVEFMDTSGVQLLVSLRKEREHFAVVRGDAVQRIIDISGMTPHLRMMDAPEDLLHEAG